MKVEELDQIRVIDTDTHVLEPYDLWTSRVSVAKYGDKVPHVQWDEERQEDVWCAGGASLGVGGAQVAAAGWTEPPPKHPARIEDVSTAIWQPGDRLALMSEYGIHAQVLYPNVPFAGFGAKDDHELELLLIRAYNDYLSDFSASARDRLLPMTLLPFWDIELSIAEANRCAGNGHRGVIFSQAPESFGQPRLADRHWDRLWAALQELGLPVNFHIATGGDITTPFTMLPPEAGPTAIYAAAPVIFFLGNARTICQLVAGGVCHRFPELQFVSVESGVGWIPFVLNALDWMWRETDVRSEHPEYDLLPSEYFQRQISGCFWFEHGPSLDAAIATLGADRLLYMTDFPHPTSMSPGPASGAKVPKNFIAEDLGYLDTTVLQRLLHDNAATLYHLD
jgi:predicted TIM-barrel fold metal-dependent hydrolase